MSNILGQRLLVLNGRPLHERPLRNWLGHEPEIFMITSSAVAGLARQAQLCDYHAVWTVEDYADDAVQQLAITMARRHRATRVISCQESDVMRAADIRQQLGLPGQDPASAAAYRDKLVMRRHVQLAGIRQPQFKEIASVEDIRSFVSRYGLPVVLKPRFGSGSIGIRFVHTRDQLARLPSEFEYWHNAGGWLVETFINAPLFHVDGITMRGRAIYCWPSAYSTGNAEAIRSGSALISIMLASSHHACNTLREFASQVHSALPAPPHPTGFHLEAWLPADHRPILCEVAARPTGPPVAEMFARAFGAHLIAEHHRGQSGTPLNLTSQPDGRNTHFACVRFLRGHGTFTPAPACPLPGTYVTITLPAGTTGAGPSHIADRAGYAIVEGTSTAHMQLRIAKLLKWWEATRPWRS